MAPSTLRRTFTGRLVAYATAYDAQDEPTELVVPEDLSTLDDDALSALIDQFAAAGAALYAPDEGIIPDAAGMETMRQLAEGAETLRAEQAARVTAAAERATEAAALAAQIAPVVDETETEGEDGAEGEEAPAEGEDATEDETAVEGEEAPAEGEEGAEALAASGRRRGMNINLGAVRSRQSAPRPRQAASAAPTMRDFVTMAPNAPLHGGAPADFSMMAQSLSRQLSSFPEQQFSQAARNNRHLRQQFGLATIRKPFDDRLVIGEKASDAEAESILAFAADESRLPGGSLVASGGWCAPSETLYDLFEIESTDGTYSLPEVNAARGSIRWTAGPTFASIFGEVGFSYTAAQDEAGDYGVDGNGVGDGSAGSKPCYHLECPDFDEESLSFDGLCITAGLLERRSYPELLARVLRGSQVAHDHKMSAHKLTAVANGSTHVSLPSDQVGATAPILTAIELQVEHIRSLHRTRMGLTMEAVFPSWVRGAIRSDLSRRQGVDLIDVPDSRIGAWFTQRGINPQFVYGLSDISTTAASGFNAWPTTLDFLLYPAGTWVVGGSDIITLDTVYDSQLLGTNDFTALFSEEGWMVLKRGHDSRRVTVPLCADGATHIGVAIDCDGSTGS
jgi:hypothetical protein